MLLKSKGVPVAESQGVNRLIDSLPVRQRSSVLALCEPVDLACGTVLCEAGKPFKHAYFPITGNISRMHTLVGHTPFEIENIGSEGMLGATLILNINCAPHRGVVQIPCLALCIQAKRLRAALQYYPALCAVLQRYLCFSIMERSQTTGCIRFHDVGKRLARGLLLAQDCAPTERLPLTHQLLADMLGVQRGAVTLAAIKLQEEGIIRYSRGKIAILDRQGLELAACGCYRESIKNYASILF